MASFLSRENTLLLRKTAEVGVKLDVGEAAEAAEAHDIGQHVIAWGSQSEVVGLQSASPYQYRAT